MIIRDFSNANLRLRDPIQSDLESEKLAQKRSKEDIALEEEKKEEKTKNTESYETFVMSAADMRELFLIMGSRGSSKPIETLAQIVKEQRKQKIK